MHHGINTGPHINVDGTTYWGRWPSEEEEERLGDAMMGLTTVTDGQLVIVLEDFVRTHGFSEECVSGLMDKCAAALIIATSGILQQRPDEED